MRSYYHRGGESGGYMLIGTSLVITFINNSLLLIYFSVRPGTVLSSVRSVTAIMCVCVETDDDYDTKQINK